MNNNFQNSTFNKFLQIIVKNNSDINNEKPHNNYFVDFEMLFIIVVILSFY